jgi:hypothetical protein
MPRYFHKQQRKGNIEIGYNMPTQTEEFKAVRLKLASPQIF